MSNRIKALKRINIDIKAINEEPIEGIGIASIGEDLMRYVINMRLMNGPYEGYCVQLLLIFTDNYPVKPPKILIYPNQAINGEYHHHIFDNNSHDEYNNFKKFCFDLLDNDFMPTMAEKTGWNPGYSISFLLLQVQNFISDPDMGKYVPSKILIDKLMKSMDSYTRTFEVSTEDGIIKKVHTWKNPYPEMYFKKKSKEKENSEKNKTKENDNTKISSIEKGLKALDDKINTYEFDQLIENIAILMEKQNDNKIYEMINKLETQISDIKQKLNKRDSLESSKNKNKFDPELINKINNHENLITKLQTKLNKIQDEKQIDNSSKNKLSDIEKQSNDLKSKVDSLITLTKKLENNNKELNSKTNDLSNKFSQISVVPNPEFQSRKISNPKTKYYRTIENQNINQEMSYYNRTNPNINTNLNLSKDSFNSKIVNFSDITFLQNRIMQINPKIREVFFSLVYRASEDGDKAANFHQKCDRIGPNVVLIKTKKGSVFGGFTFRNWEHLARDTDVNRPNLGSASRDSNAFGFNVNKQKIYNNEKPNEFAIWCNRNFGPTFKNNLFQIFDHSLKKGGYCNLRKNSNFGGQLFDYEISGGEPKFKIDELEVFEVKLL